MNSQAKDQAKIVPNRTQATSTLEPEFDFDQWARAVRSQLLAALAKTGEQ